jgi:hypothetical protein
MGTTSVTWRNMFDYLCFAIRELEIFSMNENEEAIFSIKRRLVTIEDE